MSIELRHLRVFLAVAKEGNFRRAAERLNIAQPALSRTIRDLEQLLGVQLFERTTRSVTLTAAGRVFLPEVNDLLEHLAAAIRLVRHPGRIVNGKILFAGRDLLTLPEREMRKVRGGRIGMIFQDPSASLNPVMSVGRQIGEAIEAHNNVTRREARRQAVDMLHAVRIPEAAARARSYPHEYSGGMRQRVSIAIGTANHPELVIADEPTTALDVTVQAQIISLLANMNRDDGTAIIFISHNIALVSQFCSRVLVMYAGRIVEEGPTREVFGNPGHPYTAALLKAVPRVDKRLANGLETIEGRPPDLARKPSGCAFHPRCPARIDQCAIAAPPKFTVAYGHASRCWLAADAEGGNIAHATENPKGKNP